MNAQTERKISRAIQTATRLVLALPAFWPVSFPAFAICVLPPGLGLLSLLRRVVDACRQQHPSPSGGGATDHNSGGSHRCRSLTYLPLSTSASQHNARLTPVCELDAGLLTNYQPFAC
jgi:hypothetical protein